MERNKRRRAETADDAKTVFRPLFQTLRAFDVIMCSLYTISRSDVMYEDGRQAETNVFLPSSHFSLTR